MESLARLGVLNDLLPGFAERLYLSFNQYKTMQFRRFFLSTIAIAGSLFTNAQFQKGDKMVGTNIASALYNSGSSKVTFANAPSSAYDTKTSSYSLRIEPSIGWFISDKTIIGVGININPSGQKIRFENQGTTFQEDKSSSFNLGAGPFIRHYFGSGSSFIPFGQYGFNAGFSTASTEGFRYYSTSPNSKQTYEGDGSAGFFFNTSLQLGMTKMMGENAGLDIYVGYSYSGSSNKFKTTTLTDLNIDGTIDTRAESEPTTKYTNHGAIVGVGFQVFLRKKKK